MERKPFLLAKQNMIDNTDIKVELQSRIDKVKAAMAEQEVGSVKFEKLRLELNDLEENLANQDLPAQSFGNTCVSCEG